MTAPKLHGDFETHSVAELKDIGAWKYALHPTTAPWCLGWNDGEERGLWRPDKHGWECPDAIRRRIEDGFTFVAHNAPFEYAIWNSILAARHGWPRLEWEQVECTMSRAYAMALPGSLEYAGAALGLPIGKDKTGHALMMRMARPWKIIDGRPIWLPDRPGKFTFLKQQVDGAWCLDRLCQYCEQDVLVEMEIDKRTLKLTPFERRVWLTDMKINERGVHFDMAAIDGALEVRDQVLAGVEAELARVTGGAVEKTTALQALKEWLFSEHMIIADSLDKNALEKLLADPEVPDSAKAALKCRATANRATSVSKLDTVKAAAIDGRVKGTIQYSGAGTRRFSGRLIQPHNFPRDLPDPEQVELLMSALELADAEYVELVTGEPVSWISQCLRGFIVAAPGCELMGGDWSNVEGRGTAWLAGEQWKLDAFAECDADPDLPDMYKRAYAKSYGIDPRVVTKDQRQVGKVMELAFGYEGGAGAWRTFEATYGLPPAPDEQVEEFKDGWRAAHPMIAGDLSLPRHKRGGLWRELERAAIHAVADPGIITEAAGGKVKFRKAGSFLFMRLPSGGALCYPYPELHEGDWGDPMLTYKTVPSPTNKSIVCEATNTGWWSRVSTYGGKLTENAVQALCRDILVEALLNCEANYLPVVLHAHDEIIAEGRFTADHERAFHTIMNLQPEWAAGFPVSAGTWRARRYRKE